MLKPFDEVREQLERQYLDAAFDPATGYSKEELSDALAKHRVANPDEPRILTKAWLLNLLCSKGRIAAEPGDPFVGKLEHHGLLHALRREWQQLEGNAEFRNDPPIEPGALLAQLDCGSHICPDWKDLLKHGVKGLRDRAATHDGVFFEAVATVFDGFLTVIDRYNKLQPSPELAALTERPPATLHEALQLTYIYHELMELDGMEVRSMGRFDLLYNDFYLHDLAEGCLTRDEAKELLKYFWIKFYAKTQGKRFGKPFLYGPHPNELSYLAFEVYHEMRIVDPKFHIRIAPDTPRDFLESIVRCILDGCTSMVMVNDAHQIEMLVENGKAREDAQDYILIGCYEPAIQGKELNCSGASALNLAKAVECVLAGDDFETFDALFEAYLKVLDKNFSTIADRVRRWEKLWPRISPTPFLSGTMASCVDQGLDISEAGAKYNTSGCVCAGLANAVDSLAVIRQFVYEEKSLTLTDLRQALADNWEGHETLRLTAMNRVPKWGNNDDTVDDIAVKITDFLGKRINHEPNARGGVFQAALYGITVTAKSLGTHTGALPDGRRAGELLTLNTGATPGMDRMGITSLINSVTRVNLTLFPNGTVLDVMFHPTAVQGAEGIDAILSVIQSHFSQGGMAIQLNIFDAEILKEAQKFPEKYANLQVRVCGWNSRFADLTVEEQNLFIQKAEALG